MGRTFLAPGAVRYANEAGTGTTLNKLAKLTGAPSTAILTAITDTSGIVGIVVAGAGTTGSSDIAVFGKASCAFDSATTAGHYVQNDTSTAGGCMDAGATYPTSGQVIGIVTSTNGGAGTYEVDLSLGQPQAGGAGGGGGESVVAYGSLPGTCTDGTAFSLTDSLYRIVCDPTNTFNYFYNGIKVTPPPSAGWTWEEQGASTVDSTYGFEYLYLPKAGADVVRNRNRAAPATPYTLKAGLLFDTNTCNLATRTNNNAFMGIGFRESGTGRLIAIEAGGVSSTGHFAWRKWNSATSASSTYVVIEDGTVILYERPVILWLAIRDDGTNLTPYASIDGVHWQAFDIARARNDFFTTGPDQLLFGGYTSGADQCVSLIHWELQAGAP
jgi:hypothetical protein